MIYSNIYEGEVEFSSSVSSNNRLSVNFGQISALDGKKIRSISFDNLYEANSGTESPSHRQVVTASEELAFYLTLVDYKGEAFIKNCPCNLFAFPIVNAQKFGINRLLFHKPREVSWVDSFVSVINEDELLGSLTYIVDYD